MSDVDQHGAAWTALRRGLQGHESTPLAPTLALTVAFVFAGSLAAMGAVLLLDRPSPVPCFNMSQNQDAETTLYLLTFGAVLPLGLLLGPRVADHIAAGPNGPALEKLTGVLLGLLVLSILGIKASTHLLSRGLPQAMLGAAAIWWTASALALRRAARPNAWEGLLRLAASRAPVWPLAGLLAMGAMLCLAGVRSVPPSALTLSVASVAALVALSERTRRPRLPKPWSIGFDVLVIALLLLIVPDMVVIRPERRGVHALETSIIQFHQNFMLGPANEVLTGGAMLVDTVSQYGVASIYALAAWFHVLPIGYGTFGLLSGVFAAFVFGAGYCLLRIAGTSRPLSALALAVAVVGTIFNPQLPINSIPQDSALRFGWPMAVLLPLVAAERWPRLDLVCWSVVVAVMGVSSIWSLEAIVYALITLAVTLTAAAGLRPEGDRFRWLVRRALIAVAACLCAHIILAVATWAASGSLPDWGQYLAFVHAHLLGAMVAVTFDVVPWSPGLAVGALYLASAVGLTLLLFRRPDFVRAERVAIVALAGVTAYGVIIYSYYNNRSTDFILAGVALPAFLAPALWTGLASRSRGVPRTMRSGAQALVFFAAALVLVASWPSVGERYARSTLAHMLSGGPSVEKAYRRLLNLPPVHRSAAKGQRLLERFMADERRSLVLTKPDLQVEILLRARRGNVLPTAMPLQDSFIFDERQPDLKAATDALRAGQRMLVDELTRDAFTTLRKDPSIDPLAPRCGSDERTLISGDLAPVQVWALKQMGGRFDLHPMHRGAPGGLSVVELRPRPGDGS